MAFATGLERDPTDFAGGEVLGTANKIHTFGSFEDGLKVGRFAKLDSGRLDNMDGSSTPLMVGVVRRNVSAVTEDALTYSTSVYKAVDVVFDGEATVFVKSGDTPSKYGRVYASNAGDANDGMATTSSGQPATHAVFVEEVKTGIWKIALGGYAADIAAHVNDATNAHMATAIGFSSSNSASTDVDAALEALLLRTPLTIADPGDGGAIPVTKFGTVAITTAGAETRTLAIPTYAGQQLLLGLNVDGGDCVITSAQSINAAGNTTITLNDAGDFVKLEGITIGGALRWRVIENAGATLG